MLSRDKKRQEIVTVNRKALYGSLSGALSLRRLRYFSVYVKIRC